MSHWLKTQNIQELIAIQIPTLSYQIQTQQYAAETECLYATESISIRGDSETKKQRKFLRTNWDQVKWYDTRLRDILPTGNLTVSIIIDGLPYML